MAEIKEVELRPSKTQPTVTQHNGYRYVTFPPKWVRIHVNLDPEEEKLYADQEYRIMGQRAHFGSQRCEWDKCKNPEHKLTIVYDLHDNPYNSRNVHVIAAKTLKAIHVWLDERRLTS